VSPASSSPTDRRGPRLLVVDDEVAIGEMIRSALEPLGYIVETVHGGALAKRRLTDEYYDGLLVDLRMPDVDGWEVLDHLKTLPDHPITLVMSAFADVAVATEAMRKGAVDFIEKPFRVNDLVSRLERALEGAKSSQRIALKGPIAVSERLRKVFDLAERVARAPSSSALLVGESGVGKEIVATHIHESSSRRNAPFLRVNLSAIPETMVEAELFGSAKGAFTDAKRDRPGLLASADGGTLLLDEITEFKIDLQPKLLRVLEERRYFPIGRDKERKIDLRILAATNRNPLEAIADGHLRQDLFYRLSTVIIEIPPLRKRPEDIMPLAEHFLSWFAAEFDRPVPKLTDDAKAAMTAHAWPGNVRELRNVIERAVIMADHSEIGLTQLMLAPPPLPDIRIDALPSPPPVARHVQSPADPSGSIGEADSADAEPPAAAGAGGALPADRPAFISRPSTIAFRPSRLPLKLEAAKQQTLEAIEKRQIQRALELAGGNRTSAANMLGISRTTLWEKVKLYGL
jgi:DNA-binding NtrC family response regulator